MFTIVILTRSNDRGRISVQLAKKRSTEILHSVQDDKQLGFWILTLNNMGDQILRHFIAAGITIMCILAYYAGYVSSSHGWWWTVLAVLIVYGGVYKMVDK